MPRPSSSPSWRSFLLALLATGITAAGMMGCGSTDPAASGTSDPTPAPSDPSAPSQTQVDSLLPAPAAVDSLPLAPIPADSSVAAGIDSLRLPSDTLRPPRPTADVLPPSNTRSAADEQAPQRAFVNADSLRAFTRGAERLQDLVGNVFIRQDSTRLRSNRALRYLQRDSILFSGNVRLFERGDSLYADTLRYNRRLDFGRATGNVQLTDGRVTVFAPSASYDANAKRAVFPDSIILVDSARVLRASAGVYQSDKHRADFYGNVRMTERRRGQPDTAQVVRDSLRTYMEADSTIYFRDTDVMDAWGDVFIERHGGANDPDVSETDRTYLLGHHIRNDEQNRESQVHGRALLVQIQTDSLGRPSDTLFTAAERLHATRTDTLRRVIGTTNVRIWNAGLAAIADSAVYDRRPAASQATEQEAQPLADSSSVLPADSLRPSYSVPRPSTASPSAPDPSSRNRRPSREDTRLFGTPAVWFDTAQLTGAPIRVVARNRSLDSVFVDSDAFAVQRDSALDRLQQLKGRSMVATFRRDSLRRLIARPNARTIWFRKTAEDQLDGAIRASGDRIVLRFSGGDIRKAGVYSGIESSYFRKHDVPDPFALEGLQWMPERAPTKDEFLRQPRLQTRGLGRRPSSPLRPVDTLRTVRTTPPPPDTTAARSPNQPPP